jgi:hypothetical protein
MKSEEYLDRLIERREHGMEPLPVPNDEIAASLAAAQTVAQLNQIDIPPAFAQKLELSIRSRARDLARQNGRTLPTTSPLSTLRVPGSLGPSRPLHPKRSQPRRVWIAALGIAAALLVACVGILTVSAHSLPGDALYGLRQAEEQFKINFASSPRDRIGVQIDQLHSALTDLNTVANSGRGDDAIRMALNTVADKTNNARGAVAALPAGTDRDAAQQNLDSILAGEDQTLRALLNQMDWPIRLAITGQLGALGDPVPTVTVVTELTQSNGTLLITLTGTHFAPDTRLVIDGQSEGTVIRNTPQQLVAVIGNSNGLYGEHDFGVLNPDGTAAHMTYERGSNHDQQDGGNGRRGTPGPTRTPNPDE